MGPPRRGGGYRDYGEFIENGKKPADPAVPRVKAQEGHFDPEFHGWDLDYPDVKRAWRFIEELHRFETGRPDKRRVILVRKRAGSGE